MVVWPSGSTLVSINEVTLRRAWLVPWGYCYAELAVFVPSGGHKYVSAYCAYPAPTRDDQAELT